ncbi:ankyrin repeat domain-containing protein 13B [Leucoraja erinacea]|uniref:ankyrin repeat domain-containing protein 13B n=1 Tax=Leucoraja erinaceus TaxID=7782 RepID=UPI0024548F7D|nr:ankyrin repeat domain-containing protein 13B [Leucoraja erinacea]
MISTRRVAERYPLHYLVWYNKYKELEKELSTKQVDTEELDPRGRTPLHLAVTLGFLECARVLLKHGGDVSKENHNGWTGLQEAVSTGDLELVQLVLRYRDYQRSIKRLSGIPCLLEKLRQAQDFYVEMKWEFTSWVPLVSKICPSDTYRVWKSGQNLRVDTTLLGFDHMTWQRGNRSFIFRGQGQSVRHGGAALSATRYTQAQPVFVSGCSQGVSLRCHNAAPSVSSLLAQHPAMPPANVKTQRSKTPLQSFLGIAEQHVGTHNGAYITQTFSNTNPTSITPEEYFNPNFDLGSRDIGRPMELTTKTQKFKAKLWLCEDHPLSLADQVAPIIDLMAISNALFAKLRDFITLRLPPGFPVKIEIPIFHILNARITFGNLNGSDERVTSLRTSPTSEAPSPSSDTSSISSTSSMTSCRGCDMDPALFEVPRSYTVVGTNRDSLREEDDDLLQFAIQQSLLEAGTEYDQVTIWEALTNSKPGTRPVSVEERNGESSPEHSNVECEPSPQHSPSGQLYPNYDEQLRLAMELSTKEQEEVEKLKQQEEEELERIIQLSLTDK